MSLLCKCIRLNLITDSSSATGGAECEWAATDAKHATFTVELLAGEGCGGTTGASGAQMSMKMNGCGRLKITVSGQGSLHNAQPDVLVYRDSPAYELLSQAAGEGGLVESCGSADLTQVFGDNPVEVSVCCGHVIELFVGHSNELTPALTVEFAVEVVG